jgi:tetratricopeptide (TPR) repeat protein
MILTQCAVCATDLGLTRGKKCGRCSTRYCGPECQVQHWNEGGHDTLCKPIKKAGGAEQYNANKKYAEALAVAVEKCADDTKGQKCYICLETVHARTGEGLVRGCACGDRDGVASGSTGIAHVSCLAEEAKTLVAEALDNNLGDKVFDERLVRWRTCSLCKQQYHGVVRGALGWACWKTYVGRPETDGARVAAMTELGTGLYEAGHYEDTLCVQVAELAMKRRLGASEESILVVQGNLAGTYYVLGRHEEASPIYREAYSGYLRLLGAEHENTILLANNYADSLIVLKHFEEAKKLLHKTMPVARRVLGENHETALRMRSTYAVALVNDQAGTLDDLREAVTTLEETVRVLRRVFGGAHPTTTRIERNLQNARAALAAHEGDVESVREAVEAMTPGDA